MESPHALLSDWESFYVIVGSSAGALTGLQFVVMALVAESPGQRSSREIAAFGTPTIVHFCAALLISAVLSAPWPTLTIAALTLGAVGVYGLGYVSVVIRRARGQGGYRPVFEDWLWHAILPFVAYTAVVASAVMLPGSSLTALFLVAIAAVLLLFIGIHNAWDTVTYIALERGRKTEK